MADRVIQTADLSAIESNLATIHHNISAIDTNVDAVNRNVNVVYDEIGSLAKDFHAYVHSANLQHELELATTKLGNVRQELDLTYGHYAEVRRTTTGILQATDLGIVQNETITTATEELMLECPQYWLAPCLVALASWINDRQEIAEKALKEALRRDDEKSSLLFGLICRRAERKTASLKWIKRYLQNQDPECLGRETIVVLDAYAAGLFAADSENAVADQLAIWIETLSAKPGFLERQTDRWKSALNGKRKPIGFNEYEYLRQYSHTWPVLNDILEGARLHQTVLSYFEGIYAQPTSQEAVKVQLDEILTSLVSGFDDEELPLRSEEHLCELIIEFDGDKDRATAASDASKTIFEEERDFTQLLTDAAMNPEISKSSISSQKFAIAYSKEWVLNSYRDLSAENRMKIPGEIEINIDTFNDKTADGSDEPRLVNAFNTLVTAEKEAELSKVKLTEFDKFCQYGGFACLGIGALAILSSIFAGGSAMIIGVLALVAGIGLCLKYNTKKKYIETQHALIENQFEGKREKGLKILKATIAEIVDFRCEFETKDKESSRVIEFMNQLSAEQYVKTLAGSPRKVNVKE